MRRLELIGAPTSAGAHGPGQEKAPAALRQAGLVEALQRGGTDVQDGGDLPVTRFQADRAHRTQQSLERVAAVARDVAGRVKSVQNTGRIPMVLGGECTITIGVIGGLLGGAPDDLGLLYVDGDIDLGTPVTTRSGILDNMGIAHIVGMAANELSGIGPRRPLLPDERIVLFGYEPAEQESIQLEALGARAMHRYPSSEVHKDPPGAAARALADLQGGAKRILLHFDVDVIDSIELPLGDFPHFNAGLSFDEAMTCLRIFLASPLLAGVVITEVNPDHDPDGNLIRGFVQRLAEAAS